ncbi:hypothetical protein GCM10029963_17730 [Micromonospora andamanensis]
MRHALAQVPTVIEVLPSDANFLLFRTDDPQRLCAALAAQGIRLRDRSNVIDGGVRLSIGTPEENDDLLRALKLHG